MFCVHVTFNEILLKFVLTLSRRLFVSYRNQAIDVLCKSMDWFLYDRDLSYERVRYGLYYRCISCNARENVCTWQTPFLCLIMGKRVFVKEE